MLFDEFYTPLPDVDAYLARIGMERPEKLDFPYLEKLIYQHLLCVPFENIDVKQRKMEVSLAIDDLFHKIVIERRGGYCFELNSIFYELLKALGYDVTPCLNKVIAGPFNHFLASHRSSIVHMDGKDYYCDVGFGGPAPAGPLLIKEDILQEVAGDKYRLVRENQAFLTLFRTNSDGQEEPMLSINPAFFDPLDFIPYNHYLCCSSDRSMNTFFKENLLFNIRTEDGYASIINDVMKQERSGKITITDVSKKEVLLRALHEVFLLPESIDAYF